MAVRNALRDVLAAAGRASGLTRSTVPSAPTYFEGQTWIGDQFELDYPRAVALVPTVYATITRIAQDVAKQRPTFYRVGRGGKRVRIEREKDNIIDIWMKANELQSGYEMDLWRQASLDTSGKVFLYLERFGRRGGQPFELHVLPGHLVRPVLGALRTIEYYEWCFEPRAEHIDPANVVPFHYWNPSYDPLAPSPEGLSPLSAARLSYEAGYQMKMWQREWYKGGGRVAHIFAKKADNPLTEQEVKQMRSQLMAQANGIKNLSAPVFVKGVEVHKAGLSLADMKFLETSGMSDGDVREVYGMPRDGVTKDNKLEYVEGALVGRFELRDQVLNEWYCPLFGEDIICETDISMMLPIQQARLEQAKALVIAAGRPVITVNEARQRMDLDDAEDETADELFVQSAPAIAPQETPTATPGAEDGTRPQAPGSGDEPSGEGRQAQAVRASADDDADDMKLRRTRADMNLKRYERRIERWAIDALDAQERATLERARALAERSGMDTQAVRAALNPDDLFDEDDVKSRREGLQREFERLMQDRGEEAAAQVGRDLAVRDWLRRLEALVRTKAAEAITKIDETTRQKVRDAVTESVGAGESYSQLVARLRQVFDDRRGNVQTIARTETAWAYNSAAQSAWEEVGVAGKSWLTVGDDNVRDTCRACEAQGSIGLNEVFSNGLSYPGDTSNGDPGTFCNCRCVLMAELDHVKASRGLARYFAHGANGHANGHANRLWSMFSVVR